MKNLNLLFNKTYYTDIASSIVNNKHQAKAAFVESIKRKNTELWTASFDPGDYVPSALENLPSFHKFCMKTTYPGLLVGTGYAHGTGMEQADSDINMGFSFDYVSGQPYIPGSSVKGLLRSCFRQEGLIEELCPETDVTGLVQSIFEADESDGKRTDTFLDAVIRFADDKGHVVGTDTITPHTKGPTQNPTPIQIIKIMPNVIIEFRFLLHDDAGKIKAAEKAELFRTLLELVGIGAKTNVGYGALLPCEDEELKRREAQTQQAAQRTSAALRQSGTINGRQVRNAVSNEKLYRGKVTNITNFGAFVMIPALGKSGLVHISEIANVRVNRVEDYMHVGDEVTVNLLEIKPDGKISLSIKNVDQSWP